ncbi:MAG: hypothetical protein L6Q81_12810 [Bacteroidia bacterium]|nr:hypothetical protein [Bacteroidia bacterium]
MKKLSLLSVLLLLLSVHLLAQNSNNDTTSSRIVDINGRYQMAIPNYLTEGNDLNDEASLQYQNIYKEVYIIVIDEPKQEFKDVFIELGEYDTSKSILENYTLSQMESIKAAMITSTQGTRRTIKSQSSEAIVYDVSGTQEGIEGEMGFTVAFLEGRLNLYMILTWTFQKDKPKYQADMDAMIASFKELSGEIDYGYPHPLTLEPGADFVATEVDRSADLEFTSKDRVQFVTVHSEPLYLWDSIYASNKKKPATMLDFYSEEKTKSMREGFSSFSEIQKLSAKKINNLDARVTSFSAKDKSTGVQYYYYVAYVQGKNAMYRITCQAPISMKFQCEKKFEQIAESFKE